MFLRIYFGIKKKYYFDTVPLTIIALSSDTFVREDADPEEFGVEERSLSNTWGGWLLLTALFVENKGFSDDVESAESNDPLVDSRFLKFNSSCNLHLLSKSDCILCCRNFASNTCCSNSSCLLLSIFLPPTSPSDPPSKD